MAENAIPHCERWRRRDDPSTEKALINSVIPLLREGRQAEAIEQARRVAETRTRRLPKHHVEVVNARNILRQAELGGSQFVLD